MATVSDIVTNALRRAGWAAEGETPDAYLMDIGVGALNDLINSLPDRGVGEKLGLSRVDASALIGLPGIYAVMATGSVTLTLPKNPTDGYRVRVIDAGTDFATRPVTLARNGWLIAGAAADATLSTNGQKVEYVFRADLADWRLVSDPLDQSDEIPFPSSQNGNLEAILLVEMGDLLDRQPTPAQAARASSALTRMQSEYGPDLTATFDRDLVYTPSRTTGRYRVID